MTTPLIRKMQRPPMKNVIISVDSHLSILKSPLRARTWFGPIRAFAHFMMMERCRRRRDYTLSLDTNGPQILNIFGGKITTHRKLAEQSVDKLAGAFPGLGEGWTARVPLPGGDFPVMDVDVLIAELRTNYAFLDAFWARRLVRAYGTEARVILGDATSVVDLGQDFGATLTEREAAWLMSKEYAVCAEDIIWRRSKLGLRLTNEQIQGLEAWMDKQPKPASRLAAE